MTKTSIMKNPAKAERYVSRRFPHSSFNSVAYETDAPPVNDKRTEEELLEKIKTTMQTELATRATKQELEALVAAQKESLKGLNLDALRAMADDKTGAMKLLQNQGLEITRLQAQLNNQGQGREDLSLRGQIATWQKANADAIKAIKSGSKAELPALEIRAVASPMTVATVNPTASPYIGRVENEGGINDFIRIAPTFWDFIVKGRTNAPLYTWVNKTNPQGAAAFIGPGVAKPGVSFEMVADQSIAKKIADSAKATTELLDDIDGMATFIEQELRYQVMIKVNSTLMDSVGSSTVPTGIKQLSSAYVSADLFAVNANYMDAIRAVVGKLRSGLLTGEITVFINSIDAANMDMAKATDSGVYLLPPFVTSDGRTIAGARIVEDNNIPVGQIQAGFMRFYRILIYKDFSITWGWENDDFTRNLVTAVGEMRLHQFFNQIHTGAFIRTDFDTVIASLKANVPA